MLKPAQSHLPVGRPGTHDDAYTSGSGQGTQVTDWATVTRLGLCVFPLHRNSKRPALDSWDPYKLGARATPALLAEWQAAGFQPAVATNATSGVTVFEVDSLDAWAAALERGLPDTFTVKTPRGWHYYFQHPGWPVSNRANLAKVSGWDVRGDKGYVVGPGSYYVPTPDEAAKGKVEGAYVVELDVPFAPLPAWLAELLAPAEPSILAAPRVADVTSPWGLKALHGCLADLAAAQPGHVNETINTVAFRLAQAVAGGEIVADEALDALQEGLDALGVGAEEKARGTMQRGWDAGLLSPRAGPEAPSALEAFGVPPAPVEVDAVVNVPPPPVAFGPPAHPTIVGGGTFAQYFAGCVYVAADNAIWVPGGVLLKRDAFNVIYGGPSFYLSAEGAKPSKGAWDAFSNNEVTRLPRVARTVFRPERPPGAIEWLDGLPVLNAYAPIATPSTPGDAGPFVRHVAKLLPDERDANILLQWMASCVQNPGAKFQWWPVIQGTKGNGKTLLLEVMFEAVGSRYSHLVNAEALQRTGNQFNAWIDRKLFLGFEEIHTGEGQHHFTDMMKTTVTNRRIAAEGKGAAQGTIDNRANGMMLTNHRGAVPVDDDERRYGIFHTAQQSADDLARDGMTGTYFPDLYDWLRAGGYAIVTHYLRNLPLRDALDPARGWRAPVTSSTADAKAESLGNVELEILDRIEQGAPGFKGGWISSVAFGAVMERMRIGRKRWPAVLRSLGYVSHPNLKDGRVTVPLSDNSKPRLYVTMSHWSNGLHGTAIGEAYEAEQAGKAVGNVVPFGRP